MKPFERHADTRLLIALLDRAEIGETVTYEQMQREIGRPVSGGTATLVSARRILLSESGKVFDCERGVGLVRLADGQKVETIDGYRKRQHALARKSLRVLETVEVESLDQDGRRKFYTALSHQGVLAAATTTRSVKKISAKMNGDPRELAVAMTLEALQGNSR